MIKKTVSYETFDGETATEDLYFHLNKAELLEMEVGSDVAFTEKLKEIAAANNAKDVLGVMKSIIIKAYGVRSEDGKRFIKNDRIREEFEGSEAYSEVLFQLLSDPTAAAQFIGGLMPKDLLSKVMSEHGLDFSDKDAVEKFIEKNAKDLDIQIDKSEAPAPKPENKELTAEQMANMSHEELVAMLSERNK